MNARASNVRVRFSDKGFSLIDVLVAVVVLSVGLLALAALQGNIVRGASAARTQTQAMALAQEKLEQLRGFTAASGGSANAAGTYDGIMPATESLTTVAGNTGANTFTRTTAVTRYQLDPNGNGTGKPAFVQVANCSNGTTGCPTVGKFEYKRVTVTVATTDASGNSTSMQIGDVISVASPSDTANTLTASSGTHPKPQVWIDPTKFAAGVIPIALSGTQSAAASDPQPESFSTGHITTRFSVQNYNSAANGNGLVLLNKQFDFAATSCTCNTGSTSTFTSPAFAPTYWNGTKYVTPTQIPAVSGGTGKITGTDPVTLGQGNGSSQDPILCQACCRDHHDADVQKDADGNLLRVDPFRPAGEYSSGDHKHYDLDSSGNLLTTAVTGSNAEYYETCRFVRVDGINRVATDARLENHILIAPPSAGSTQVTAPSHLCDPTGDSITTGTCYDRLLDTSTTSTYVSFVEDYVAGFHYNSSGTAVKTTGVSGFYDVWKTATTYPISNGSNGTFTYPIGNLLGSPQPASNPVVDVALGSQSNPSSTSNSTLAQQYASLLNLPTGSTTTNMVTTDQQTTPALQTNDQLYTEARGIYIDYISPEAKIAINCIGNTTDPNCTSFASQSLLQVIPFVAVNLTNLDAWTDNDNSGALGGGSNALGVSNDPIPTGGTYDPFKIGYDFDRGSIFVVDDTWCGSASSIYTSGNVSQPSCKSNQVTLPDYTWARARRGNAGLIDSLSVSASYPHEAYYCISTWSGSTPSEPTGVCSADPPPSGTQYATATNTTASNGNNVTSTGTNATADGVNYRSDTQPYVSSGTTSYELFKASTSDKTVLSGNAKSNLGNPVAISVTTPSIPRTISTCKLGKGGKQPFHCYDSDSTSNYSPISLKFANYNTQVSCNGANCPTTPVINTYNLCKISVPSGVTASGFTVANSGLLNETTAVTLTLPSLSNKSNIDSYLTGTLSITACFATSATTCSTISCP